ncbi:MAG: P1 family peptidase [Candidatus Krumholzibacteriota bacterium]|nr:P1 family peptidase [Candidatus Krumholzibacteriota bacterium]
MAAIMQDMDTDPGLTNDRSDLNPVTEFDGDALRFDFPGLEIGVAEYAEGPTGCTVFRFPAGSTAVADVRGGAPGTSLSHREGWVDAICLAGGSVYGLEASAGVSAALLAGKGYDTRWMNIAIVSGAVIYDFNQFRKNRALYPDKKLGRAALEAAREGVFPLGARGAGVCATVGKWLRDPYQLERSGQGGAFHREGDVCVAAFTVVNAVGAIVDRNGRAVRGHLDPATGKRHRVGEIFGRGVVGRHPKGEPPPGNTTLTVVITNQVIGLRDLRQLARQVHSSMARAIDPFHTLHDGDVLYAVTTNQIDPAPMGYHEVSFTASELAWDAVLCAF